VVRLIAPTFAAANIGTLGGLGAAAVVLGTIATAVMMFTQSGKF